MKVHSTAQRNNKKSLMKLKTFKTRDWILAWKLYSLELSQHLLRILWAQTQDQILNQEIISGFHS